MNDIPIVSDDGVVWHRSEELEYYTWPSRVHVLESVACCGAKITARDGRCRFGRPKGCPDCTFEDDLQVCAEVNEEDRCSKCDEKVTVRWFEKYGARCVHCAPCVDCGRGTVDGAILVSIGPDGPHCRDCFACKKCGKPAQDWVMKTHAGPLCEDCAP